MKKLLVIIMSLSTFHAYHPIELVQPFVEVGVIVRENLIGPLSIKAQINSFIKGGILGVINNIFIKVDTTLMQKQILQKDNYLFLNASNGILLIDLTQNRKDACIISTALGLCLAKKLIAKYLK